MNQERSLLAKIAEIPGNFWRLGTREKTQVILALLALAGLFWLGAWGLKKVYKPSPKDIYEVAVFAHDQSGQERTSLRIGDVLVVQNEGHSWSQTERISYLILKMVLTEEQKNLLLQADEREIPEKEWSQEERERAEEEKKMAEEDGREYRSEPRWETLRPRLYRIKLESRQFTGFSRDQLMSGQPYAHMVFDWGVVEKKKGL